MRPDGSPLVFGIGSDGSGLSNAIVESVAELVNSTPQDVSTRALNQPGNPDNFNASTFIKAITPNEGYHLGNPGEGYSSKDDVEFYRVTPGTEVAFDVSFQNDVVASSDTAKIYKATIFVAGTRVATLDTRNVYIVVPPAVGEIIIY